MTTINRKIQINAPKQKVWDILADLGAISNFNPYVTKSYYTSEQREGVGAARHCDLNGGFAVDEKALAWDEGNSLSIAVEFTAGMKPPVRGLTAHISLHEKKGGTMVDWTFEYGTKFGPVGMIMNQLMLKRQYATMLGMLLAGLKYHAETDEVPDMNVARRIVAVAA